VHPAERRDFFVLDSAAGHLLHYCHECTNFQAFEGQTVYFGYL